MRNKERGEKERNRDGENEKYRERGIKRKI